MIKEGELILLYAGEKAQFLIKYSPLKVFECHLGKIVLPENLEFGAVVYSSKNIPFYVLAPSISDIILKVRRKTTIMYPKDIGYILLELGIGAGKRVIEAGTGSGALTIVLANAVGEEGIVYSFERREEFLKNAIENVKRTGLAHRVKFYHRDVSKEGFGVYDIDAAIIDVPEPWTIIPELYKALKPGHGAAFLSPNIEQVQKTYKALRDNGFTRLKTVEIFEREIRVKEGMTRPRERMVSHTGYLTFAYKFVKNES